MIKYEDVNFWDAYPVYRHKKPFMYIYKKHKKTKRSSNMAWFVHLYCSPESEFFTYNPEMRREELEENLTGDVFTVKEVQQAIKEYDEHMCTIDQRAFKHWAEKLLERAEYLSDIKYSSLELSEAKDMDSMLQNSVKIWDAFSKVKEQYEKTKGDGSVRGGGKETFLDTQ